MTAIERRVQELERHVSARGLDDDLLNRQEARQCFVEGLELSYYEVLAWLDVWRMIAERTTREEWSAKQREIEAWLQYRREHEGIDDETLDAESWRLLSNRDRALITSMDAKLSQAAAEAGRRNKDLPLKVGPSAFVSASQKITQAVFSLRDNDRAALRRLLTETDLYDPAWRVRLGMAAKRTTRFKEQRRTHGGG